MEVTANEVFDSYKTQYYEGGASSVYCWELDETSFAACVRLRTNDSPRLIQPPAESLPCAC